MAAESGRIELIVGPMFSGKTAKLIRRLRAAEARGEVVVAAKPSVDERFGPRSIVSHDDLVYPAETISSSRPLAEIARDADVVGVDELQFLPPSTADELAGLREAGKRVIVAGLGDDYRGVPFEVVAMVAAITDDREPLKGVCAVCGAQSTRTQRLLDGEPTPVEGPRILVGSEEIYETRCEDHFVPPAVAAARIEAQRRARSAVRRRS
jgi:thymidine kinase